MSRSHEVTRNTERGFFQDPFFSIDDRQLWLLENRPVEPPDYSKPQKYSLPKNPKVDLKNLLTNKVVATYEIPPDEKEFFEESWNYACVSPKESLVVAVNAPKSGEYSVVNSASSGTLYAFDLQTKKVRWKHYVESVSTNALAFSPDGKILAWGGTDRKRVYAPNYSSQGKLCLLNTSTGKVIQELTKATWADSVMREKVSKEERVRKVFGIKPKARRTSPNLPGDNGAIHSLAFSPDSKWLAVGYFDGHIRLWKIK